MFLSYKYKLRPSNQQVAKLSDWLNMLRATYNWYLRDRIEGWHEQFLMGNFCDLKAAIEITPLTCSLVKGTQLEKPWKTGFGKAKKKVKKISHPNAMHH